MAIGGKAPVADRSRRLDPVDLLIALGLLVVVGAVFSRALDCEFVAYDDGLFVTGNKNVQAGLSWAGIQYAFTTNDTGNWFPLTWISLLADTSLYGVSPLGFHFTSALLHTLNSIQVYLVLFALTGNRRRSAVVAAIFGLHPLRVESAVWIAERTDVLSAFFGLLTTQLWLRYARAPKTSRYVPVLFAYGLSLLAKSMWVTLPFLLLLLDYWPLHRLRLAEVYALFGRQDPEAPVTSPAYPSQPLRRLILEKLPLLVLAGLSSASTLHAQGAGGVLSDLVELPLSARVQNAFVSYLRYLGKLAWPTDLAVLYPLPKSWPAWRVQDSVGLLLILSALVVWQWRKRPFLIVGWLWFLGMLVPVIGLVQNGAQSIADRYTYFTTVGIITAVVWLVPDLIALVPDEEWRPRLLRLVLPVGIAGLLCLEAATTWAQIGRWHDSMTLFTHVLAVTDENAEMRSNYGKQLALQGRLDEAIVEFREAVRIDPKLRVAHYNLGLALSMQGRTSEALDEYRASVVADPKYITGHVALAQLAAQMGLRNEAIEHFRTAATLRPDSADYRVKLAQLLEAAGNYTEATTVLEAAHRLRPSDSSISESLDRVRRQGGTNR
jgi:tetratricopeptide (TPR) repeat protein